METLLRLVNEIDLPTECVSFPEKPENEILRTEFLDSIDDVFRGDAEVLFVDGPDGIGKTTLCAQFARRHRSTVFSLFIRPSSRMCSDPSYLHYDLCCQVHLAITREPFTGDSFPQNYLLTKLPLLQRLSRRLREPILFVVDGLADLAEVDLPIRQYVLQELMQLGAPGFRFLLTGEATSLLPFMRTVPNHRSQIVTRLSWRDVELYLEDLALPDNLKKEIESLCKGNPGRLAQVRRIIKSGVTPELLAEKLQDAMPDLFRVEWEPVRGMNAQGKLLLSILAFDRFPRTVEQLALLLGQSPDQVRDTVSQLSFLKVEIETAALGYASESFRRFAADQLRALEPQAISAVIDKLLEDDTSEMALLALPSYLERVGRYDQLITVLNPEHITRLATKSGSLQVISDRVQLGLTTARRLHRQGDMTRFSIHSSVISEVLRADAWKAEVAALVALDDYAAALALAENAILKEDVLYLLATVGHAQVKKKKQADTLVIEQVRRLATQIDALALGPRASKIAAEIVSFAPDLAIDLVERSAANSDRSDNSLDAMYVSLSISAIADAELKQDGAKVIEEVKSKIKEPQFKLLSTAVSVWALDYGVEEVIAQVDSLEKPEDRIFLLRHWATINAAKNNALRVAEHGIRLAIQTTAFSTNAGVFRELATPLRFSKDVDAIETTLRTISPQLATLEATGPMSEYVRLQMHLVVAESKYDKEAMSCRLLDVFTSVREHNDLYIRAECTAALLDTLKTVDPAGSLEQSLQMHSTVAADLESDMRDLLSSTADHHDAAKGVVRALATRCFDVALDIRSRLNTEPRRDTALEQIIDRILELPLSEIDLTSLDRALALFSDNDMRDDNVLLILERFAREGKNPDVSNSVVRMLDRVKCISGARVKTRAAALAYKVLLDNNGNADPRVQALADWQIEAWRRIDVGWHRINIGFDLVSLLADIAPNLARQYVDEISTLRREPSIDAYAPTSAFELSLRLAIRTWGGIIRTTDVAKEGLRRIGYLIDRLPSAGERAKIYAHVAISAATTGRSPLCREIVAEKIEPLLNRIQDERYLWSVVVRCAPALYANHRGSALDRITRLPPYYRDEAYLMIAYMVLGNYDPSDPYKYTVGQGYPASYESLLDAIELAGLIDNDSYCYFLLERICDSVATTQLLSREQKADIPGRLDSLIARQFPNSRFIKHDGFKLVAVAQKARLEAFVKTEWDSLLSQSRNIANTADRAYVLFTIASLLPAKQKSWREDIFAEARNLIAGLPAVRDKLARYQDLAEYALEHSPQVSRECLEAAVKVFVADEGQDVKRAERIIDLAYQIDPNFASSLASLMNDDPAKEAARQGRESAAKRVTARLETLRMSRELGSQDLPMGSLKKDRKILDAAWMKLGALNAGKATVRPNEMAEYLQLAGEFPLSEAYPLMCWVIQNAVRRFKGGDQEILRLSPQLEATLLSAGLAQQLAARTVEQYRTATYESRMKESSELIVVKPGERLRGIDFIRGWITAHVHDYLKICDPFFSTIDLEVLKLVKELRPTCRIHVLTSRKEQERQGILTPYDTTYRQYLNAHVLSDDPPPTEIVIAGTGSGGDSPIHDRWWLSAGSGLRIGTSFNSLGISKESEVSIIAEAEAAVLESRVDEYLLTRRREFKNERVTYSVIVW